MEVISIHALREEGDNVIMPRLNRREISIHALREEGDAGAFLVVVDAERISIHALREEGDFWALSTSAPRSVFLSTPSARRATSPRSNHGAQNMISIHALREEGDHPPRRSSRCKPISIHALREEGDGSCPAGCRLSVWISIHALREEGDMPDLGASYKT